MSATNKTTNYDLPIYAGTDKPTYLGDWNSTMTKIDAGITGAKAAGDGAVVDASNAKTIAQQAETAATNANNSVNELAGKVVLNTASIDTLQEQTSSLGSRVTGLTDITNLSYTVKEGYSFAGDITGYLNGNVISISGQISVPAGTNGLQAGQFDLAISGKYSGITGIGNYVYSFTPSGGSNTSANAIVYLTAKYNTSTNQTIINGEMAGYNDITTLADYTDTEGGYLPVEVTLFKATE